LVRKASPPLAIRGPEIATLRHEFTKYVTNIALTDLENYTKIAYDDQKSSLPEVRLRTVSSWYTDGLSADEKVSQMPSVPSFVTSFDIFLQCELLREAIEMHITSTIFEPQLVIDEGSMKNIEGYFQEIFAERSTAKVAQRQIKSILFEIQQLRVLKILKEWGSLISSSISRGHSWEASFCVFLIFALGLDKTFGMSYNFCEVRIAHNVCEPDEEKREFFELIKLMEVHLFANVRRRSIDDLVRDKLVRWLQPYSGRYQFSEGGPDPTRKHNG
jgi:hypothetical protein